ncbi:phosphonoacetaldehyde hydrolase [Thiohalocapsa marina]|uniref:Phosphonoacetaldehyde hydrolase n=1 Tax=Thiohalocapsa marina TaxID=424902 RepID=A0A5M8FDV2_9GAMM|nr:photosynthetic complex assembly protein PuhC [Thiohalocapsa marina]KAA6182839.1 phosphonoacetaldehyde hydrolase [Thiohalocapsa marina]
MSDPFEGRPFPREVLIGAALLIGFVIAATVMVRLTGVGGTEMPITPVVESRQLVFIDNGDGTTTVRVPDEGRVADLESGVDGFVLGVMRGMVRERNAYDAPLDAPYLLSRREDGRLLFEDPSTGRIIDVRAFGPTNMESFARLLRGEIHADPTR